MQIKHIHRDNKTHIDKVIIYIKGVKGGVIDTAKNAITVTLTQ